MGFGWNEDEMDHHGVQYGAAATRAEHLLAMRRLWEDDEAEFHGEFVDFSPRCRGEAAPAPAPGS